MRNGRVVGFFVSLFLLLIWFLFAFGNYPVGLPRFFGLVALYMFSSFFITLPVIFVVSCLNFYFSFKRYKNVNRSAKELFSLIVSGVSGVFALIVFFVFIAIFGFRAVGIQS